MFASINKGQLQFNGRSTTSDIRDEGPVLLTVACRQSKETIGQVADLLRRTGTVEVLMSSDLYHPASCGAHPRFDGVALIDKALDLAGR